MLPQRQPDGVGSQRQVLCLGPPALLHRLQAEATAEAVLGWDADSATGRRGQLRTSLHLAARGGLVFVWHG